MNKIIVLALMIMLVLNHILLESAAEIKLKKSDEARCTQMYKKFLEMGEANLRDRYPAYSHVVDLCLKLFHDPKWSFTGKNLIDKDHLSDSSLLSDSSTFLNSKILSKTKIGPNKFLVKFNVCFDNAKRSNYLEITTDTEKFIGRLRVSDDSCVSFWTLVRAISPENTQFSGYYDVIQQSKIKKLL